MALQPWPGTSTWMISGVLAMAPARVSIPALKWSDATCAAPASASVKASRSVYLWGSSTLRDQS